MRTAWPDRLGTERSPAGGARSVPPSRIDWARLAAWAVVVAIALVFWSLVGLLITVVL